MAASNQADYIWPKCPICCFKLATSTFVLSKLDFFKLLFSNCYFWFLNNLFSFLLCNSLYVFFEIHSSNFLIQQFLLKKPLKHVSKQLQVKCVTLKFPEWNVWSLGLQALALRLSNTLKPRVVNPILHGGWERRGGKYQRWFNQARTFLILSQRSSNFLTFPKI